MIPFFARRFPGAIVALALIALMAAASAGDEPPATTPAPAFDSSPLQIRCRGRGDYSAGPWFGDQSEKFRKSHPEIAVRFEGSDAPFLEIAKDLAAGKLEVALLAGPSHPPNGAELPAKDARRDVLLDLLTQSKCEYSVIRRRAMAVVVHPQNPLQEIEQAQVERLLATAIAIAAWNGFDPRRLPSWKTLGQEDRPIRIVIDRRIADFAAGYAEPRYGKFFGLSCYADNPLAQIASDRWLIAFVFTCEPAAASGLKILPVRPTGGKEAVLPSPENVISGKYPFSSYLLVASRPAAPPPWWNSARCCRAPRLSGTAAGFGNWITRFPARPARKSGRRRTIERPRRPWRAAAVLPLEPLTAEFVMGSRSHYAAYEQAIADAIGKDGRLRMVDRAELARVLQEYKLGLAQGAPPPPHAIITADVLVLSSVVTTDSRAYLLVQAVHAATTNCLGRMKLAIDPARPEKFLASIGPRTRWWPGVLRNLAAALDRPVWTILPPALPEHATPHVTAGDRALLERAGDIQASLEKRLLADRRVFYARPGMIPDAQREVLMGMLGIARPVSSRFTPLADYLLQCDILGKGRIRLQVLRGRDLQAMCATTLEPSTPAAAAGDWIWAKLAGLVQRHAAKRGHASPAAQAAVAAQAAMELQTTREPAQAIRGLPQRGLCALVGGGSTRRGELHPGRG